jgi:hypothetical protein
VAGARRALDAARRSGAEHRFTEPSRAPDPFSLDRPGVDQGLVSPVTMNWQVTCAYRSVVGLDSAMPRPRTHLIICGNLLPPYWIAIVTLFGSVLRPSGTCNWIGTALPRTPYERVLKAAPQCFHKIQYLKSCCAKPPQKGIVRGSLTSKKQ